MGTQLRVSLSEDGADPERMDALTRLLRDELLQLDLEEVRPVASEAPPPGTRAVDAAAVAGLLVSLGGRANSLRAVVNSLLAWLGRGHGTPRTVRLEIEGEVLEVSDASTADQERLIGLFVDRHTREASGWTPSDEP